MHAGARHHGAGPAGTWWLPAWLDRLLPQLQVEGDPKALEQETVAAAAAAQGQNPLTRAHGHVGSRARVGDLARLRSGPGFTVLPTAGTMLPGGGGVSRAAAWRSWSRWPPRGCRRTWRAGGRVVPRAAGLSFAIGAVVLLLPAQAVGPGRFNGTSGWLAGWAIVLLGLALVAMSQVPVVLPAALGALAMAITLATEGAGDAATALMTCLGRPSWSGWWRSSDAWSSGQEGERAEVRDDGAKRRAAVGPELADGMQAQAGANATEGRQAR